MFFNGRRTAFRGVSEAIAAEKMTMLLLGVALDGRIPSVEAV